MESMLGILYLQHDMVWLLHFHHGIGLVVCGWYIFSVKSLTGCNIFKMVWSGCYIFLGGLVAIFLRWTRCYIF